MFNGGKAGLTEASAQSSKRPLTANVVVLDPDQRLVQSFLN
jgi:hypothetical protein